MSAELKSLAYVADYNIKNQLINEKIRINSASLVKCDMV